MSTPAVSDRNSPYFQAVVPGVSQALAYTNTAADTITFQQGTTLISIFSTTDCWVLIKESTSSDVAAVISSGASGSSFFLPGGIQAFVGLPFKRDVLYKASIIRNAADGTAHITEAA